jgi:hypothetical protein
MTLARRHCTLSDVAVSHSGSAGSLWLAQDPSKRWTEIFFLCYSAFWILWVLCILVPFGLYEVSFLHPAQRKDNGYRL